MIDSNIEDSYWKGKRIGDMSRGELLQVIKGLHTMYNKSMESKEELLSVMRYRSEGVSSNKGYRKRDRGWKSLFWFDV